MSWFNSSGPMPKLQLVGYTRERVLKGQKATVTFTVTSEQMWVWDDSANSYKQLPGNDMEKLHLYKHHMTISLNTI